MQRPQKPKGSAKRKTSAPATLALRDRAIIAAWLFGFLAIALTFLHIVSTRQAADHLDRTLERWRLDYHLTSEQAERVRVIERKFHGSGNPFLKPSHTAEETTAHHREIAATMDPENGARFFRDMEGKPLSEPTRPGRTR